MGVTETIWDDFAENYTDRMLNVWLPGVVNPLYDFLREVETSRVDLCIDFGCGHGHLVEHLSELLPRATVIGLDNCNGMLKKARELHPHCLFETGDLRNLSQWCGRVDLGLTVNSIVPPSPEEARRMLAQTAAAVAVGGHLMGVLPSADTIEYLMTLSIQDLVNQGMSEDKARETTEDHYVRKHRFDAVAGLYADDPDGLLLQKVYRPEEIRRQLIQNGFEHIRLEKVYYPWEAVRRHGWGWFPEAEEVWDWAFSAEKTNLSR